MANNGFELQKTVASSDNNCDKRQSIPVDSPQVPSNGSSTQGPPKPSKSNSMPTNGTQLNIPTVEYGSTDKSKDQEAVQSSFMSINLGYFKSWQALLKVTKLVSYIKLY